MRVIEDETSCWEWQGSKKSSGYGEIGNGKGGLILTHRCSWELECGDIPKGMHVLHRCDNKVCVRPEHLFLGTLSDNTQDMLRKGRAPDRKGSKHPNAKITEIEARKIRNLYASGQFTMKEIGRLFFMTRSNIGYIVSGKAWTHA